MRNRRGTDFQHDFLVTALGCFFLFTAASGNKCAEGEEASEGPNCFLHCHQHPFSGPRLGLCLHYDVIIPLCMKRHKYI